jgi:GGDEF domain-containing protein
MDGRWDDAYARLTGADRRKVPAADFREWKDAVARSYRIGSYAAKLFRRYVNCSISGTTYREVYEFSVFVCDMDSRTGQISEVNYLKYVALDGGAWRVCLGYADLKPLILRFKYMAEEAALLDPAAVYAEAVMSRDRHTGLLSRQGFSERAEYEAVRSRRYGNIFTVALLILHPAGENEVFTDREYARMCVAHAAKAIAPLIRQTDIFARWGEAELAILFTETPRENAGFALEKLLDGLKRGGELDYSVSFGLAEFDGGQFEDTMAAAASDAQVRVTTSGGVTKTYVTVNDST